MPDTQFDPNVVEYAVSDVPNPAGFPVKVNVVIIPATALTVIVKSLVGVVPPTDVPKIFTISPVL